MFEGADNGGLIEELEEGTRRLRRGLLIGVPIGAVIWVLLIWGAVSAFAQNMTSDCSQTVGAVAAAVPFPASGKTGPSTPHDFLLLCDAHAANTLGVNSSGGTAAIGSAGTLTLQPGGCEWWDAKVIPPTISVIGSGAGTTTACAYH